METEILQCSFEAQAQGGTPQTPSEQWGIELESEGLGRVVSASKELHVLKCSEGLRIYKMLWMAMLVIIAAGGWTSVKATVPPQPPVHNFLIGAHSIKRN